MNGGSVGFPTLGHWSLTILVVILNLRMLSNAQEWNFLMLWAPWAGMLLFIVASWIYLSPAWGEWMEPYGMWVGVFERTYYNPAFYAALLLSVLLSILPGIISTFIYNILSETDGHASAEVPFLTYLQKMQTYRFWKTGNHLAPNATGMSKMFDPALGWQWRIVCWNCCITPCRRNCIGCFGKWFTEPEEWVSDNDWTNWLEADKEGKNKGKSRMALEMSVASSHTATKRRSYAREAIVQMSQTAIPRNQPTRNGPGGPNLVD